MPARLGQHDSSTNPMFTVVARHSLEHVETFLNINNSGLEYHDGVANVLNDIADLRLRLWVNIPGNNSSDVCGEMDKLDIFPEGED